jgi:hypothetical protein
MIPEPTTAPPARNLKGPAAATRPRGRPARSDPRRITLPRVTASAHQALTTYATRHAITSADALDRAIHALGS